jgi:hypothetical protein
MIIYNLKPDDRHDQEKIPELPCTLVRTMKLYIDDTRSFQSVQYEFSERYPFLKIDFIRPSFGDRSPLFNRNRVRDSIGIGGNRTVTQVVKDFEEIFGLCMVILRRSGNVWIETSLTVDWTLEQQNREGQHISQIG